MPVSNICGVIIATTNMDAMLKFYQDDLGLPLKKESHGGLDVHYGMDMNNHVHFALHPPSNFRQTDAGHASIKIALMVTELEALVARLAALSHVPFIEPHDAGFGTVATYKDPDGNLVELVELRHVWKP